MNAGLEEIVSFSNCIYDVDNRYVDLYISKSNNGDIYRIKMKDTSYYEESDAEIKIQLSKQEMKLLVELLEKAL